MSFAFHHGLPLRPTLLLVAALAFGVFTAAPFVSAQGNESLTADQVKAGFIYNFTRYIEWPLPADTDRTRFHVCTAGEDGVVDQLEVAVQGKVVDNRRIFVIRLRDPDSLATCEVLYVANISRSFEEQLAAAVAGLPVLTVGNKPGFLRGAGMLTFVIEDNRVRFDVDVNLARKVNIRFDSRLLALARRTDRGTK
ncbi:MAG: YfiR family protein [Terriglobales bacterium]